MAQVFDTHCHLGFADNPVQLMAALAREGVGGLCCTVTPEEYDQVKGAVAGEDLDAGTGPAGPADACAGSWRVGLGAHPWWIADGRCGPEDVSGLCDRIRSGETRFVGEVGLDFGKRGRGSQAAQTEALERIAQAATAAAQTSPTPPVLSLHAVNSAATVLDILEKAGCIETCSCILHWFSGSSDDLVRARKLGCLFSVNAWMLRTRRGRAYAQQIPTAQLLLETDLPGEQDARAADLIATDMARTLRETLLFLSDLRQEPAGMLAEAVAATSTRLLRCSGG